MENKAKRKCPYCGEEILMVAKKCKHCGEWIKEEDLPSSTEQYSNSNATGQQSQLSTARSGNNRDYTKYIIFCAIAIALVIVFCLIANSLKSKHNQEEAISVDTENNVGGSSTSVPSSSSSSDSYYDNDYHDNGSTSTDNYYDDNYYGQDDDYESTPNGSDDDYYY